MLTTLLVGLLRSTSTLLVVVILLSQVKICEFLLSSVRPRCDEDLFIPNMDGNITVPVKYTLGHFMSAPKDRSWNSMISAHLNMQIFINIGICPYCFLGEEGT